MAIPNVALPFRPGNCCSECGAQKKWAYRPKPEKPADCGPTILQLSDGTKLRQSLRRQLEAPILSTGLPKERVAHCLFNMPVDKYQNCIDGEVEIPKYTEQFLSGIESVERSGSYVTVIYNIGAVSPRWNAMQHKRQLPADVQTLNDLLTTQTKALRRRQKQKEEIASCASR